MINLVNPASLTKLPPIKPSILKRISKDVLGSTGKTMIAGILVGIVLYHIYVYFSITSPIENPDLSFLPQNIQENLSRRAR